VGRLLFMKPIGVSTSLISFDTVIAKADLSDGQLVADLGCGNSLFFLYALSTIVGKNGKVLGIDILPNIIQTIEREIEHHAVSGVNVSLGNLDKHYGVSIADKSLDRAFLINTLHQSGDSITMLTESARMLKPKALLIIVDWNHKPSPLGPHGDRRISLDSVKESAEVAGLKHIESFKAGDYHYGAIFEK